MGSQARIPCRRVAFRGVSDYVLSMSSPPSVTRIERRDIDRVLAQVRVPSGTEVTVSGWHHAEGWSRGFSVKTKHHYVGPVHDNGRYVGVGWMDRMAQDIQAAVDRG